jgi:hypothetical protein
MPSTVIFKSGYPSAAQPVETQASIQSNGMISGIATFVLGKNQASGHGWAQGRAIAASLFNSLRGVQVQGLFVDSLNLEKRGGLFTLRVGVIGAVNPPIVEEAIDVSPRSISKSSSVEGLTITGSFDYLAETRTVSAVIANRSRFSPPIAQPKLLSIFNRQGLIFTTGANETNFGQRPSIGSITARERIITTETRQNRNNIVTVTKTSQFIYE